MWRKPVGLLAATLTDAGEDASLTPWIRPCPYHPSNNNAMLRSICIQQTTVHVQLNPMLL